MKKLTLLFCGLSFSFSLSLAERFIVPIYYDLRISSGYDSNLFLFSEQEMNSMLSNSSEIKDISYYDSGKFKLQVKSTYMPHLFQSIETRIISKISRTFYPQVFLKNYNSYNVIIDFHLGSYNSLKIGYSFIPEYFLRRYSDIDLFNKPLFDCFFSKSSSFLSYTFPIKKSNWIKLQANSTVYYFNPNFTEFDIWAEEIKLQYSFRFLKKLRATILTGITNGINTTYKSGLNSTIFDRSYQMLTLRSSIKFSNLFNNKINFIRVQAEFQNRSYLSESENDALHNGRESFDFKLNFTVQNKLAKKLFLESYFNFHKRQTLSNYKFVEELKSFGKFETGLRLIMKGYLDIYY